MTAPRLSRQTRFRGTLAAFISTVAVVLAACGGGADPAPPVDAAAVRVDDAEIRALTPLSDYQLRVLADRTLTLAEYESAALETSRCLKEVGATIVKEHHPTLTSTYAYSLSYPVETASTVGPATDECALRYISGLSRIWGTHKRPTESRLQEAREALGQCLRDGGVSVPEHPGRLDLQRVGSSPDDTVIQVFALCVGRIGDQFGMPGFGG